MKRDDVIISTQLGYLHRDRRGGGWSHHPLHPLWTGKRLPWYLYGA